MLIIQHMNDALNLGYEVKRPNDTTSFVAEKKRLSVSYEAQKFNEMALEMVMKACCDKITWVLESKGSLLSIF